MHVCACAHVGVCISASTHVCVWGGGCTVNALLPPQGVTKGARNKILQNISSLSQRHKTLSQMEKVSTLMPHLLTPPVWPHLV